MLKKNKKMDRNQELEVSKMATPRRFSMSSNAEDKSQRTVIGEHIFIEGEIRSEENL